MSWGHRVTVIESGKEDDRDLDFLPQYIIIASVTALSSLSLNLFTLIQILTPSVHFCMGRRRSGVWWGAEDFWSSESSAYEWWRTECISVTVEREAVYKTKTTTRPRTDPCRTPNKMGGVAVDTDRVWSVGYDKNHFKVVPCIPTSWWRRWSNMLWSIVSKAADKSKRARNGQVSLS